MSFKGNVVRILRIYQKIPPSMGGMEKHIANLTKEQKKAGFQVDVYFVKGDKLGVNDIQFGMLPYTKIKPQALSNFLFYINISLFCFFNKKKYDVIHIHGDWSSFVFSKLLKLIVSSQGVIGSFHGKISPTKFRWFKFAYKQPDTIYVTGKSEEAFLNHHLSNTVSWIHSGVNCAFYKKNQSEKYIDVLTVANCLPVKNIDLLLDVAKSLPDKNFVHIGGGSWKEYSKKAKALSVNNIEFRGALGVNEVALAMSCAKSFLLTSFEEGTPTVILEALVSHCYVVTTNSCDLSGIINEQNGYVSSCFDVAEISEALSNFLNSGYLDLSYDYSIYSWSEVAKKVNRLSLNLIRKG